MPNYNDLRPAEDYKKHDFALVFPEMTVAEKKRTIEGLLRLRPALDQEVAVRRSDRNLLVASWNVKEFGHTTQRLPEAFFYMAEIIARFDLVIVQEVTQSEYARHTEKYRPLESGLIGCFYEEGSP